MDVKQMREEKQKLANAIGALLSDFTHYTDLRVESVDIKHVSTLSDAKVGYIIDVEVSL